jgi:hypothetical protein
MEIIIGCMKLHLVQHQYKYVYVDRLGIRCTVCYHLKILCKKNVDVTLKLLSHVSLRYHS